MYKKILFGALLIISTFIMTFSVNAACSVWRHKTTDVKTVRVNDSLSGEDAPIVCIGWSRDHTDDLSFFVKLQGAEWDYGNSGTIQQGVTYSKVDNQTIEVNVDVGTGSDEINFSNGRNIYIPINCTVESAGEIRVLVDSNESTVSNANILIAKAIDGRLTVHGNKTALNKSGQLKKITITDSSTQSYKANQRFTMTLDTSFRFTGDVKITGTGKFENLVKFEVDKNNSAKAYVTITGTTPQTKGEIILEDVGVFRNTEGKFAVVLLNTTFNASMVPLDSNLAVASYDAEATASTTTTKATTESTTETTTEATTKTTGLIKIQIGASNYTVDGTSYPLDVPAYISSGSTMLPLRALSNAMGISDNNIDYDVTSKKVTLMPTPYTKVTIVPGENKINLYVNNEESTLYITTPAEIKDGRIFLPLRAMANALGISDSAIDYDSTSKTVTLQKA